MEQISNMGPQIKKEEVDSSVENENIERRSLEEGITHLPKNVANFVKEIESKGGKILKIRHESYKDEFAKTTRNPAMYHLYFVDADTGEKILASTTREDNPFNDLRLHSGVDMATPETWSYYYDGKNKVTAMSPKGKKKKVTLNEEKNLTLESLEAQLRRAMGSYIEENQVFEN